MDAFKCARPDVNMWPQTGHVTVCFHLHPYTVVTCPIANNNHDTCPVHDASLPPTFSPVSHTSPAPTHMSPAPTHASPPITTGHPHLYMLPLPPPTRCHCHLRVAAAATYMLPPPSPPTCCHCRRLRVATATTYVPSLPPLHALATAPTCRSHPPHPRMPLPPFTASRYRQGHVTAPHLKKSGMLSCPM